jgi:hypothetical protein
MTTYTDAHAYQIGPQAAFAPAEQPSALDYFLGALGGDLARGMQREAARCGLVIDELEVSVEGQMHNPLVFLGVVGETGSPGLATITCILSLTADAPESLVQEIWQMTLARSPLVTTLKHTVKLSLVLHYFP